MPVTVACPNCQSEAQIPAEVLGKRGKCKRCGTAFVLSADNAKTTPPVEPRKAPRASGASDAETAPASPRATSKPERPPARKTAPAEESPQVRPIDAELLAALDGPYRRVSHTPAYGVALAVVAAVMILLPLIYIAIIGLVGYGAYWHAIHNQDMLTAKVRGKGYFLVLTAYAAPVVAGVILIAFMLKPLIPRRRQTGRDFELQRGAEPLLFAFVDKLCDRVGAPRPRRIVVDLRVNAYAALQGGLISSLFSRRVELGIGLPLVNGMTLPQLAGVLAHEFGHFGQFTGMRLGGIIQRINMWFARVVFERDAWDQQLENWSQIDIRIGWVIYVARGMVWLTRKLLHGLMLVGGAVSGRLSRQMEFDSDRYAARLIGDQPFAGTLRRLPLLSISENWGWQAIGDLYAEGKLVSSQPDVVAEGLTTITPENAAEIMQQALADSTHWFDTHPCLAERVANIEQEQTAGILHLDVPATRLFANFQELSREATRQHYQEVLNREIRDEELVPAAALMMQQREKSELLSAAYRFVLGAMDRTRPVRFPSTTVVAAEQPAETWRKLIAVRERQSKLRLNFRGEKRQYDELNGHRLHAVRTESLLRSEIKAKETIRQQLVQTVKEASTLAADLALEREQQSARLQPYEQAWGERLHLALQLAAAPPYSDRLPPGITLEAINAWLTNLALLDGTANWFDRLAEDDNRLDMQLTLLQKFPQDERLLAGAIRESRRLQATVAKCRESLLAVPYGFPHAKRGLSLGEYLLPTLPETDHPLAVKQTCDTLYNGVLEVRQRMLGRLMQTAELIESEGGLEPVAFDDDAAGEPAAQT